MRIGIIHKRADSNRPSLIMATKLNSTVHREVKLQNPTGPMEDYIVSLKAGTKPSLVFRKKKHRSETEIPLEVLLFPEHWTYEYEE